MKLFNDKQIEKFRDEVSELRHIRDICENAACALETVIRDNDAEEFLSFPPQSETIIEGPPKRQIRSNGYYGD